MMNVEFPRIEYILENKIDKLTTKQKFWLKLLQLRQSIINLSIKDYMGINKDDCQKMQLSEFLDAIYLSIQDYNFGDCQNKFLFDDFIYIASISNKHIRNIVNKPSTKLIKVNEMVDCNKVKNTGIKTMQWLAKQPGSTIAEKIAPRNKVLTEITKFSIDTKENEATMYLYDLLYKIIAARLKESDCNDCKNKECLHKKLFNELQKLYAINTQIKQGDFNLIPKQKPNVKNNKLMCDVNYKSIWDCCNRISNIKNELKIEWENLIDILYKDLYYYILACIYHSEGINIIEKIGKISLNNNYLSFSNDEVTFIEYDFDNLIKYSLSYCNKTIFVTKEIFGNSLYKYNKLDEENINISLVDFSEDIINYIEQESKAIEENIKKDNDK